ncbi:Uma2 family endonuclease [Streptomyces sp. NPDC050997]|uniref:Uma2 family endonuclease n=1 Tax=Streptomyces sp. NPDC050997 TaxID=3155519 RepID=UPI0034460358
MTEVDRRLRARTCARTDIEGERAEKAAQYGGITAERDIGPPTDPVRVIKVSEPEGRRGRIVSRIHPKPRPGNLREVAEKIEEATGLRVQILGGKLVMSPTPRGKHAGVIYELEELIRPKLPHELVATEMSSIEMPDEPDDFVTPDLLVCPRQFLDSDDWLLDPRDIELAVGVISQSEKSREIRDKADWYAVAGVAVLLVVDPRHGTWALHTRPDNGAYQDVVPGKFGEPVRLPEPLHLEIATDGFPVYGGGPRTSRP